LKAKQESRAARTGAGQNPLVRIAPFH